MGHNSAKILRITNIQLDLYCTMIYPTDEINASLQNLLNGNQYLNSTTKAKLKKGHNSAKIWQVITNIELDLYFTMT